MGALTRGKYTFGNKTKTQIIALNASSALTGTASISSGGTTVTGVGTLFLTELFVGDIIQFSATGNSFIVSTISSNTSLTVTTASGAALSSAAIVLLNPLRIKAGDSVYNTTDKYAMYYSGDGQGFVSLTPWKCGNFVNGQVVATRNGSETTSVSEGAVMTTSGATQGTTLAYSSSINNACGIAYQLTSGGSCVPVAVCGIHNTNVEVTVPATVVTKGNFCQPSASGATIIDDGSTSSIGNCGVACTASGTPAAGQVKMLVNFQERL